MNYRHLYHAGNFGDVLKHITLIAIISSLLKKETPFFYLDTHAGAGYYDLLSEIAKKNKEHELGIMKLMQQDKPPGLIKYYLNCVREINNRLSQSKYSSFRYYPGSPFIVRHLIRGKDHMTLTELQPQEYQALRLAFNMDLQVSIHNIDGYMGLKAFLPPRERRGLVLIDPAYENPDEFTRITTNLPLALKRWETGIYAIWYPIKERVQIDRFHRLLRETIERPMLVIELSIYPEDMPSHLNGSGMIVINPPWQLKEEIEAILPTLWKYLSHSQQGMASCYLLK